MNIKKGGSLIRLIERARKGMPQIKSTNGDAQSQEMRLC